MLEKNKKIILTSLTLYLTIIPFFGVNATKNNKQPSYLDLIPEEDKEEIKTKPNNKIEITYDMLTKYYTIIKNYLNVEEYKKNIPQINNLICLNENNELNTKKFIENLKLNNIVNANPYIIYNIDENIKLELTNFLKEIKTLLNEKIKVPTSNPNLTKNLKLKPKSNLKLNFSLNKSSSKNNLNIKTLKIPQKNYFKFTQKSFSKTPSTPNLFNKTFKNNITNIKSIRDNITIKIDTDLFKKYKRYLKAIKEKFEKAENLKIKQELNEKIKRFICLTKDNKLDIEKFLENLKSIEKLNKLKIPNFNKDTEYKINKDEEDKFILSLQNTKNFLNQINDNETKNNKKKIQVPINLIATKYVNYINGLVKKYQQDAERIKTLNIKKMNFEKDINPFLNFGEKILKLLNTEETNLIEQLIKYKILEKLKNKNEEYFIPKKNLPKIRNLLMATNQNFNAIINESKDILFKKISEQKKFELQNETDKIIKEIMNKKENLERNLNEKLNKEKTITQSEIEKIKNNLEKNLHDLDDTIASYVNKISTCILVEHTDIVCEKGKVENQFANGENDIIIKNYVQNIINKFETISKIMLNISFDKEILLKQNNNVEKDYLDEGYFKQIEKIIIDMLSNMFNREKIETKTNIIIKNKNEEIDKIIKEIKADINFIHNFKTQNVCFDLFTIYLKPLQKVGASILLNIQNCKNLIKIYKLTNKLCNFFKEKTNMIYKLTPSNIPKNSNSINKNKNK